MNFTFNMDSNTISHQRKRLVKIYTSISVLQSSCGLLLIICAIMSVRMTYGQTDAHGPPYYVGAFIVGVEVLLAGVTAYGVHKRLHVVMTEPFIKTIAIQVAVCASNILSVFTIIGCGFGIVICVYYGIKTCHVYPKNRNRCNYTINMEENYSLALVLLLLLLTASVLSLTAVVIFIRHAYLVRIVIRKRATTSDTEAEKMFVSTT